MYKGETGLNKKKLTRKSIVKIDINTGETLQTWPSLSIASDDLNIPKSTLSTYIRFNRQIETYYYKYE